MRRSSILAATIVISVAALADKPAKGIEPYNIFLSAGIASGNEGGSVGFTVPANKMFVIETVSGKAIIPAGQPFTNLQIFWSQFTANPGVIYPTLQVLSLNAPLFGNQVDIYTFNNPVRAYATGNVVLTASRTHTLGNAEVVWSIHGHLLPAIEGDFNVNGMVDAADYVVYRNTLGRMGVGLFADADNSQAVDPPDYDIWRSGLQSPPGPSVSLVTNLNQSADVVLAANGTNWAAASSFMTASGTHVLDSITVSASSSSGGTSELRIRADNAGVPGTLLGSLGSQSITGSMDVTYNSGPTSLVLQPSTKYWVTLGESGSGDFGWNGTLSTSETSPAGWTIGDAVLQKQAGSQTWQNFGPPNYSGLFSVTARAQGAAAAVPEPTALAIIVITAFAVSQFGRRRPSIVGEIMG